jgi:hypothetical protein
MMYQLKDSGTMQVYARGWKSYAGCNREALLKKPALPPLAGMQVTHVPADNGLLDSGKTSIKTKENTPLAQKMKDFVYFLKSTQESWMELAMHTRYGALCET